MKPESKQFLYAIPLLPLLLLCIFLIFSARQEMKYHSCHMPMAAASAQSFYVATCRQLLQADLKGNVIKQADFADLDLSPQIYALSLANGKLMVADMGSRAAKECDADLKQCRSVINAGKDLKRPFTLRWGEDEKLYAADPNNNRIAVYNATYNTDSYIASGFDYPNDFFLERETMLVADTSNHRLVALERGENGKFQQNAAIDLKKLLPDSEHTRPLALTTDDAANYWIVLADHLIVGREILAMTPQRKIIASYALPEDGEPFGLLAIGGKVLVSDPNNYRIYTLDPGRNEADPFAPGSELEKQLTEWQRQGVLVKTKLFGGLIGALLLIVVALMIQRKEAGKQLTAATASEPVAVDFRNTEIHWIEPDMSQMRQILLLVTAVTLLLPVAVLLPIMIAGESGTIFTALKSELKGYLFLGILLLIPFALFLHYRSLQFRRIGVVDGILILQAGKNKSVAARPEHVQYSANMLFAGEIAINTSIPLFPEDELVKYVYPLLIRARFIPFKDAQRQLLFRQFGGKSGSNGSKDWLRALLFVVVFSVVIVAYFNRYFL